MSNLEEVMMEVYRLDYAEFDKPPKHHFSHRHRKAMREILYPGTQASPTTGKIDWSHIPLKKRILIAVLAIILATVGITAGATAINGFRQNKHRDYTELLTVNAENSPKTIESVYYLSEIPEGYELYEVNPDNRNIYTAYINRNTNRCLTFEQSVKEGYRVYFDTERQDFEELDINGHFALYLGSRDTKNQYGCIVWDNGDYILKISGDFTKDGLIILVKSAKL